MGAGRLSRAPSLPGRHAPNCASALPRSSHTAHTPQASAVPAFFRRDSSDAIPLTRLVSFSWRRFCTAHAAATGTDDMPLAHTDGPAGRGLAACCANTRAAPHRPTPGWDHTPPAHPPRHAGTPPPHPLCLPHHPHHTTCLPTPLSRRCYHGRDTYTCAAHATTLFLPRFSVW